MPTLFLCASDLDLCPLPLSYCVQALSNNPCQPQLLVLVKTSDSFTL